ncbi:hypothetical protein DSL72_004946 [Monilinia vaccinii-corymbosi]|uniref:RING-type domain-containing protein n=1 Tax=Monilinia vaccinii-corymbosi TaxID=61207 RepID=A0A8A3NY17_9HELO|nr:hypothetical protein DSL72_004946 [Monilinia vaccinii-corymbosi]
MSFLLDSISEDLAARVHCRHQATRGQNYPERTSEEIVTSSSTTRQSRYTYSDNTQVTEQSYASSSNLTLTTTNRRIVGTPASRASMPSSHVPSNFSGSDNDDEDHIEPRSAFSMNHGPSNNRHSRQRQSNNTRRSPTTLHPNLEDTYANDRGAPNFSNTLPTLPEAPTPYQQHFGGILASHPGILQHDHPHHHVDIYGGMLLPQAPNNLDFEDSTMTTVIERALVPTADTGNDSCAICRELYDMDGHQSVEMPGCVHIFGKECIMKWLKECPHKMTCPMCRNETEITLLV